MDTQHVLNAIKNENVRFLQMQFTDIQGNVKAVTIPAINIEDALKDGVWFDGSSIEGFARIAESDMYLKPDIATFAVIPWLNSEDGNTARFICDVYTPDGEPFEGDPRYILKKALRSAKEMGYAYKTGPELEFFLFKKDHQGNIQTLTNDSGSYFDLNTDEAYEIRREMTVNLEKFGIDVEAAHHEVAIGQHEINFKYNDALKTADNAITFKLVLKAIAEKHGLHATFMPKPIEGENGSGMHVHQSLASLGEEKNLFFDTEDKYNLSSIAYNFIAGQLTHAKALSAVLCSTVNSYKRLVPGYEAPVYISWGRNNRSALIRIPRCPKGKEQAARAELRCPDPSGNIYLVFATMLHAGLDGIRRNITPPEAMEDDLYKISEKEQQERNIETLPGTLHEALQELKKNNTVLNALGKHINKRYIEAKNKEWKTYSTLVTKWEQDTYLNR